ncbi:MAG: F420-0--gamma-glutamyl ligase, partial [Acidimicrobiia bacterium]|nr:F420-0--gamma-glutamyl ligase [Acidimicrobiia bacterium]
MSRMEIFGIEGIGEIVAGDDLASVIAEAAAQSTETNLSDGDVV